MPAIVIPSLVVFFIDLGFTTSGSLGLSDFLDALAAGGAVFGIFGVIWLFVRICRLEDQVSRLEEKLKNSSSPEDRPPEAEP